MMSALDSVPASLVSKVLSANPCVPRVSMEIDAPCNAHVMVQNVITRLVLVFVQVDTQEQDVTRGVRMEHLVTSVSSHVQTVDPSPTQVARLRQALASVVTVTQALYVRPRVQRGRLELTAPRLAIVTTEYVIM